MKDIMRNICTAPREENNGQCGSYRCNAKFKYFELYYL